MKTNKICSRVRRLVALVMVASLVSATVQAINVKHAAIARKTRSANAASESTHMRAPRPDAPTVPAIVSSSDSSLLADIASCCCNLTNTIGPNDKGICDASRWSTVDGIQNTNQSVIGWLKTIMIELRGLCQPTP